MTNWYECISVTNFSTKVSTDVYQVYYYIRLRGAPFTLVDTRMLNIFIYKSTMMQYESIYTLFTGGIADLGLYSLGLPTLEAAT